MENGETTLAWVLFCLFAVITTVATFLIVDFHRSRRLALAMAALSAACFVALYLAVRALMHFIGL